MGIRATFLTADEKVPTERLSKLLKKGQRLEIQRGAPWAKWRAERNIGVESCLCDSVRIHNRLAI